MTISEFLPYANDILIKQITPENFDEITDGTVVFSITVARGRKPKNERAITWAGYTMCIHSLYRNAARDFVRITDRGEPTAWLQDEQYLAIAHGPLKWGVFQINPKGRTSW